VTSARSAGFGRSHSAWIEKPTGLSGRDHEQLGGHTGAADSSKRRRCGAFCPLEGMGAGSSESGRRSTGDRRRHRDSRKPGLVSALRRLRATLAWLASPGFQIFLVTARHRLLMARGARSLAASEFSSSRPPNATNKFLPLLASIPAHGRGERWSTGRPLRCLACLPPIPVCARELRLLFAK